MFGHDEEDHVSGDTVRLIVWEKEGGSAERNEEDVLVREWEPHRIGPHARQSS
jgi:hypothetical protein